MSTKELGRRRKAMTMFAAATTLLASVALPLLATSASADTPTPLPVTATATTPTTGLVNGSVVHFNVNAAGFNLTVADSQVATADANGDGIQNDLQISASLALTNAVTVSAAGLDRKSVV